MIFSCIIPSSKKDLESQNLKDLIASIKAQDFSQDQIEILTITEGDSEQAKAIGIRRAKGEICAMFCADNQIMSSYLFTSIYGFFKISPHISALYPQYYFYNKDDNSLNRYFSLMGGNDPICYYLGKNDRWPHVDELIKTSDYQPSYGCNGFFYRSEAIKATNLNHYYPMDNASEIKGKIHAMSLDSIWHRTSDNLLTFLLKRYRYARDLYCDRDDRRWKMLDAKRDYIRLAAFCLYALTALQPISTSIRGYMRVRDPAWFWHWPVVLGFLITYTILAIRTCLKRLWLYVRTKDLMYLRSALNPLAPSPSKTTR